MTNSGANGSKGARQKRARSFALAVLAVVAVAAGASAQPTPRVYPGAVIVVPEPHARRSYAGAATRLASSSKPTRIWARDVGTGTVFVGSVGRKIGALAAGRDEEQLPRLYEPRTDLCRTRAVKNVVRRLRGGVCEPNYAYAVHRTPDDLYFRSQYAHGLLNSTTAWETTTGRDDLLALVVDTGIDYTHPDLIDNVWRNPGEIPQNGIDDDRNGVIDDVHGFNAIRNSGDPFDDNGHGTHVAGILGARGNNGVGIAGVTWNVKLVGLKFLGRNGMGSLTDAVRAIEYGTALRRAGHKVVVSNNSWGSLSRSAALQSAIERAGEAGILFVAAAGNSRSDTAARPFYPASFPLPNVISVAAVDSRGNLSSFSNFGGQTVHVAAPGSGIVSTYPRGRYVSMSGTSMAAPAVAGAAILVQAVCSGSLPPRVVKERILNTASPSRALWRLVVTAGIVDTAQGVAGLVPLCGAPPPTATPGSPSTPVPPPVTPTPVPSPTPSPTPTSSPTPSPSPSPTPTPRFVAASFMATVTTARGGVPGAEVVWRVENSSRVILTQRTNYVGRIGTTVSGEDYIRMVEPHMGARINVTVNVPPGYRGGGGRGETVVLGPQNSIAFRVEAPAPPP